MSATVPTILALDFDGVLCDGMIEYFQTAWRTYCQIWGGDGTEVLTTDLRSSFYRLRPVIEVGWEMPVLLRALILGIPEEKIWLDWAAVAQQVVVNENLNGADIGNKLDCLRDNWISTDLDSWLELHRFYPGVVEQLLALQSSPVQPIIITTKEGRFVNQLLQQQGIYLPEQSIIGKEVRRPKQQTLRELLATSTDKAINIWFVEDRLKTLHSVTQQPDLASVKLYLADWGYNTSTQQASIKDNPRIRLLSLSQFVQDFSAWP